MKQIPTKNPHEIGDNLETQWRELCRALKSGATFLSLI